MPPSLVRLRNKNNTALDHCTLFLTKREERRGKAVHTLHSRRQRSSCRSDRSRTLRNWRGSIAASRRAQTLRCCVLRSQNFHSKNGESKKKKKNEKIFAVFKPPPQRRRRVLARTSEAAFLPNTTEYRTSPDDGFLGECTAAKRRRRRDPEIGREDEWTGKSGERRQLKFVKLAQSLPNRG